MKFTKTGPGTYTSGRWSIVRTHNWELRLDDIKVMGYRSLATAKAGADYTASKMDLGKLDAYMEIVTA
jgi:tRNA A37 threonylcarbamoyladenosine modification protein TsaB